MSHMIWMSILRFLGGTVEKNYKISKISFYEILSYILSVFLYIIFFLGFAFGILQKNYFLTEYSGIFLIFYSYVLWDYPFSDL